MMQSYIAGSYLQQAVYTVVQTTTQIIYSRIKKAQADNWWVSVILRSKKCNIKSSDSCSHQSTIKVKFQVRVTNYMKTIIKKLSRIIKERRQENLYLFLKVC